MILPALGVNGSHETGKSFAAALKITAGRVK